eukprot:TRINITY_DN78958_c0_g1_i1.p1 TRINITY_DN78958_c0_g1~~TRINITY_DN78958_c0_g1_i1.p1  ORF type:complete len:608 (-),score=67.90 TRINITY_DN78958_c0_g1_i1:52-1845(-)
MDTPLLTSSIAVRARGPCKLLSSWSAVFSPAYLTSRMSRRTTWWWLLPLCSFLTLGIGDFTKLASEITDDKITDDDTELFPLFSQVLQFGLSCLASRMQPTNLCADLIVVGTNAYAFWYLNAHMTLDAYVDPTEGAASCVLNLAWFGAMGVHSTGLGLLGVAYTLIIAMDPRTPPSQMISIPCDILFVVFICAVIEFCLASLLQQLDKQLKIVRRLLDKASDGFGTLDPVSGIITSASEQLCANFGSDCVGLDLNFFVLADCRDALEPLLAIETSTPKQALVSCYRMKDMLPSHVFDAVVCPYEVVDGQTHFFIRIVGETREYSGSFAAPKGRLQPLVEHPEEQAPVTTGDATDGVDDGEGGSEISWSLSYSTSSQIQSQCTDFGKLRLHETATQTEEITHLPGVSAVGKRTASRPPLGFKITSGSSQTRQVPQALTGFAQALSNHSAGSNAYQASLSNSGLMETKLSIRLYGLLRLLRQWNIQIEPSVCCPLHAHIKEASNLLKKLKRSACEEREVFSERMGDVQCARCGSVNFTPDSEEDADESCTWCASCPWEELKLTESAASNRANCRPSSSSPASSRESSLDSRRDLDDLDD